MGEGHGGQRRGVRRVASQKRSKLGAGCCAKKELRLDLLARPPWQILGSGHLLIDHPHHLSDSFRTSPSPSAGSTFMKSPPSRPHKPTHPRLWIVQISSISSSVAGHASTST